jgi:GNAT superfamily N-acetyltransferase
MRPHPSGLRVTPYHALPTTTTLCAKLDGRVVGTLSIVRDGVFGFPMQTAFDISAVRAKPGHIAEISALAIHPSCRKTGGSILFPLMKFMYEYCTKYFDTRHLLIAVNPNKIEMYESLLFFQRLEAQAVDRYDFANGAPAVGATLDLYEAPAIFKRAYGHKPGRRNLHRYFVETQLDAIQFPSRPWHTTNDPVLTPALMDHFFNQRVSVLQALDERKQRLLHAIYPGPGVVRRVAGLLRQPQRITPRFVNTRVSP